MDGTERIKLRGSGAMSFSCPLPAKTVEGKPVFLICHGSLQKTEECKGVFLGRAILQLQRKSNKELRSWLLPDQDLSSSWRQKREVHFCCHFHPRGSQSAWSSAAVVSVRHESRQNLAVDPNRTYRLRCTGGPQGCRQKLAILLGFGHEAEAREERWKGGFVFLEHTLLTLQMLLVLLPAREKTQDTAKPRPENNPPKESRQLHLHRCSRSGQPRTNR